MIRLPRGYKLFSYSMMYFKRNLPGFYGCVRPDCHNFNSSLGGSGKCSENVEIR